MTAPTPQPDAERVQGELDVETIAQILAAHAPLWHHAGDGYTEPRESWLVCTCGADIFQWQQFYDENEEDPDVLMRAHQATALRAAILGGAA
jgi:hypothetical protein